MRKKPIVVFVHGFGSSPDCWSHFRAQIAADGELPSRFDFEYLAYPTKWINWRIWEEIPSLQQCAALLDTELQRPLYDGRDLVLVGHSQGGLVIYTWLVDKLSTSKARQIANVKLAVTLATPHAGSNFLSGVRKFVFWIFGNKQEAKLRAFDEEIAKTMRQVKDQIIDADEADDSHLPIPIVAFGGVTDRIVSQPSAQGPISEYATVAGNHFTILKEPEAFRCLKDALLDPPGHPRTFEIEHYTTSIRVEPFEGPKRLDNKPGSLGMYTYTGAPREVQTRTRANLDRNVVFARKNRCKQLFEIRYKTLDAGAIVVHHRPAKNEAGSAAEADYQEDAVEFSFHQYPSSPHDLDVEVYRGFDGSNQHAHFHLRGKRALRAKHYRKLVYRLDLGAFAGSECKLAGPPRLYFNPEEPDGACTGLCTNPNRADELPHSSEAGWQWEWELAGVRGGIVSIIWTLNGV